MLKLLALIVTFCSLTFGNQININFDVRTKSEVSADTLNKFLKNKLSNKGEIFKEVEKKYNVNASFMVAIAILESGNGKSAMCRKRNNPFGIVGKKFKSIDEAIDYLGRLISKDNSYYYGRKKYTIAKIAKTYAPPKIGSNKYWPTKIVHIMKDIEKAR